MAEGNTVDSERCRCGHAAGAHGLRGDPGCTFCSCEHFQRPHVVKQEIPLSRYAARAVDLLTKNPDFKALPKDALALFCAEGHARVFAPDTYLVKRGTLTHVLYVILAGTIEIELPPGEPEAGARHKPIQLEAGSIAGDLRAFTNEERWASLLALDSAEVLEINTAKLKSVFGHFPDLFMALAQVLSRYTDSTVEFDVTAALVETTFAVVSEQYVGTGAGAARKGGVDPDKAMAIAARWRELKEQDKADRAREVMNDAIKGQTGRR
ncbi:MAG: Crp/Fnr family transcriptional regulator [Chloroflexi bacterium]|nr:Crp/Fnr family transcriptional regulator [Chloroflexota bacterium]